MSLEQFFNRAGIDQTAQRSGVIGRDNLNSEVVVGTREKAGTKSSQPLMARITGTVLSHDQIVDELLLAPPGQTQGMLARKLGYTESWLSRLIASDSFQTKLAKRLEQIEPDRREMFRLRFASIEEEARGILMNSLKKLAERLDSPVGIPDELLLKSATLTSKMLGYGMKTEALAPKVEMHVHLEELASNLRNLNRSPSAIEGECRPVPTAGESQV